MTTDHVLPTSHLDVLVQGRGPALLLAHGAGGGIEGNFGLVLDDLAQDSIENPEIEFQVKFEALMINPRNYHFGDNVNMYGGTKTGIVKNAAPTTMDPELRSAIEALTTQLRDLRSQVSPLGAQTIDESLPVLAPDAVVQPQVRARALMAVAGALGVPTVEAVNMILQLLGAQ
ncbi:hypothetical protein [Streptomyces albipurpureus]|uniref:hypothetical protein n=1 Tax=Streptomyces albipurpureus TaxID=2897419 RepID=UPI0027E5392F|nr:hypothetical protein [Streptomyces sp. CWNU-1]